MNSDFVIEQAKRFAARLDKGASNPSEWIDLAYRILYFRNPSADEKALGLRFLESDGTEAMRTKAVYAQALLTSNEISYLD